MISHGAIYLSFSYAVCSGQLVSLEVIKKRFMRYESAWRYEATDS